MTNLHKIAEEMRTFAKENPFDIRKPGLPIERYQRELGLDGMSLKVTITYDILSENKKTWHLSFSERRHKELPWSIIRQLQGAFLLEDTTTYEMPSIWGPNVKQFIQAAKS